MTENKDSKYCPIIKAPCTQPDCKHWVPDDSEGHCSAEMLDEGKLDSFILT